MGLHKFSAALCRGLIEAAIFMPFMFSPKACFPRLYAAASLKLRVVGVICDPERVVFRGFMPRPH